MTTILKTTFKNIKNYTDIWHTYIFWKSKWCYLINLNYLLNFKCFFLSDHKRLQLKREIYNTIIDLSWMTEIVKLLQEKLFFLFIESDWSKSINNFLLFSFDNFLLHCCEYYTVHLKTNFSRWFYFKLNYNYS